MAVKTFTTGEVLTAADTNTYLANAYGVLVTGGSFSGVSNVIVNNCFTSTYRNYRLVVHITAYTAAGAVEGQINLRASGTNSSVSYYNVRVGASYGAGNVLEAASNTTRWFVGRSNGSGSAGGANVFDINIFGPQIADRTWYSGTAADGNYVASVGGYHDVQTAYDGFQMTYGANITGTYRVYGLRDS